MKRKSEYDINLIYKRIKFDFENSRKSKFEDDVESQLSNKRIKIEEDEEFKNYINNIIFENDELKIINKNIISENEKLKNYIQNLNNEIYTIRQKSLYFNHIPNYIS